MYFFTSVVTFCVHLIWNKIKDSSMELHFFPGQNLLALKKGNVFFARYEAWGGPSSLGSDPRINLCGRDVIMSMGGFKPKTTFVVRKYNETI